MPGAFEFIGKRSDGGKDLTPAIRVLEEKIKQMELMHSA
ncbi:hypothetical protein [Bacillus sp. YC2]